MVDKKFNFYNIYKIIYKNINKSVFLYDYNTFRDFDWEYYCTNRARFTINYIGIFSCLTFNFIDYTDWFIYKTMRENKLNTCALFKTKKIFYKTFIKNYTFFKKNENFCLFICL